jgi:alpha-ribazole phosphatase
MQLILLRHAATRGNLEHRFIGVTDAPIAPESRASALQTAPTLPPVEHIYLSPLLRCRQTADLVWSGISSTVISELRETDFGPFEGKNHEELQNAPLYHTWLQNPLEVPLAESFEACGIRASRALAELISDATKRGFHKVGVVSHGGTLMAMLSLHGIPREDYYSRIMPNCAGFALTVEENPLRLFDPQPVGAWGPLSSL